MANPSEKNWYVLYTKPRHEKKVAERLSEAGYTTYCPLYKVKRQWSDRTKVVKEPLFRSYIFIQIEDHKREEVFSFSGTLRYLFWLRKPAVVRSVEIAAIQKWLGHYDHDKLEVEDITPGTLVLITSGQFINEKAILLDQSRNKAVVQLKELGMQLTLDLHNNELLPFQG
jgi:transcription antitermination factor NusG